MSWPTFSKIQISLFFITGQLILSFAGFIFLLTHINSVPQLDVKVYHDIKNKYHGKYVYCYNYWEVCGQMAFYGRADDIVFELVDGGSSIYSRNPVAENQVALASLRGERILSFVPERRSLPHHQVLERYKFRGVVPYVLIEGDFQK